MDNALRIRALQAVCIDVAHHIVAHYLLTCLGFGKVDVEGVFLQLCNLRIRNVQPQLLLRFGKGNPKAAPCLELVLLREDCLHLLAGVAC